MQIEKANVDKSLSIAFRDFGTMIWFIFLKIKRLSDSIIQEGRVKVRRSGYVITIFLLCYLLMGCEGRNENVAGQFTLELPVDIGAGLPPTKTHYFLHRDVKIKFEEYLESLGLTSEDVLRVEPASAVLSAFTNGIKWNFVENATIYVFNPNNTNEEFLSYRTDFIPLNAGEHLNILPFIVDLKPLFLAPSIGVKTGLHFRGASPQTIQSVLDMRFNVIAD